MPGQLLSLRLLQSSSATCPFPMKLQTITTVHPSRPISIFNTIFPFKLKYQTLSTKSRRFHLPSKEASGIRRFSSRPIRSRSSSSRDRQNPEFFRGRGPQKGGFQLGSFGGRAGQGKSLIEDEAELSDWVSDLKTDSIRLSSDSDDSDRDMGRDRDSSRNLRGMGRDRPPSSKRRRESDSDAFPVGGGRASSRGSIGSRNSRGSVSKRRFDSNSEVEEDDFSPRQQREYGSRDGFSSLAKRGGRVSGLSNGRGQEGGNLERGGRVSGLSNGWGREGGNLERGGRVSGGRGREGGNLERGGRLSGVSNGRGRGGGNLERGGRVSERKSLRVLEEKDDDDEDDDDDDEMSGFEDSDDEEDDVKDVFKGVSSLPQLLEEESAQPLPKTSAGKSDSYLSETRFDQCSISPMSLKGIKAAGYERMTVVQAATLPVILKGKDVLAKAKTGTGKTVAFLLPSIEVIAKLPSPDHDQKRPPINVLIICPTRELASQAATEANTLLKYHPSIGVQVVIGGTRLALEQKRMQANPCQILVATPGRLKDHVENTPGFATRLMGVKVLVLDEADHLLDMGFRKDIEKIIAAVPKQRQTLLFSATVPEEVRQICHIALKRDHEFINTVEEGSEETHSQVRQTHLVAPLDKHFSILYSILTEHISEDVDYKVLVFCTTAMVTRLVANLLSELNLNVREIHSRKPQSYRTRVSDEFRKSKGLILVTSDVSARGVDYPDVTLVMQVGLPADREQYIHRLGRTGRKGKEGKGLLLLAPWEEFFLSSVRDLPLTKASLPPIDPDIQKKVERGLSNVEMKNKETAYQAWLGYYNSNKTVGRDKCRLVELANEFSRTMGLDTPPAIPKLILGKMGLRNVPGLRTK
ncbi:DEAD-box ATP-dependent RNA helicase 31-like [Magnolia sinica]|uniref:DEAD-box ATP-dependent RNA helicase 31-like n=1 Tax=Magnolia sinica TaxID=86752 RepID=UPI0026581A0A|nr:DEAD-box ATP-dependent RNA helicase 31-like [Magnolia sinica]XP_058095977.1 DEAD-box ATP-dependent RNA helicase 31-like [Magnolia sinica]